MPIKNNKSLRNISAGFTGNANRSRWGNVRHLTYVGTDWLMLLFFTTLKESAFLSAIIPQ